MAAALDRVVGTGTSDLIDWTDDPVIAPMVRTWPARVKALRAERLGLTADTSFDDIVHAYLADNPSTAANTRPAGS